MEKLLQAVRDRDPGASTLAREVGRTANPELRKLARNADAKVRRIALYCLEETGGPDAAEAFAEALMDADDQVRGVGARGLRKHPDPAAYRTALTAYEKSADPFIRQQVPLALGLMGSVVDVKELKQRCGMEKNPEAQEGCLTALARLGDHEAQGEFVKRLHASSGRIRARYLDYCDYIHARWLLKPLLPLLDDRSPMLRIGADGIETAPEYLRACDLSVNLAASISGHTFSFAVNRATNYNDAQMAEVRRYLEALPSAS